MIYILILVYLIILPITILTMLYKILYQLENKNNVQEQKMSVIARRNRHNNIQTNDYNNVFNNRTEYQDYQNKKGLYEPILKPHKPGKKIEKED